MTTAPARPGPWRRLLLALRLVYDDAGRPRTGDAKRPSRYRRGLAGPSPRLDEDIDELRARLAALENGEA